MTIASAMPVEIMATDIASNTDVLVRFVIAITPVKNWVDLGKCKAQAIAGSLVVVAIGMVIEQTNSVKISVAVGFNFNIILVFAIIRGELDLFDKDYSIRISLFLIHFMEYNLFLDLKVSPINKGNTVQILDTFLLM